jgi:predicted glycosyltransferase
MIYSQDGLGLGHLRRAASIATEFLRREPTGWVLTTSDSPMGTILHGVRNHDYIKLPSIVKAGAGDWHPLSLPLDFANLLDLRSRLIHEAAVAFEPDVFLVDHMPHGAMGELLPTLDALRQRQTRIVLGLRDIIDTPEVVHARWRAEGAFDALSRYYDDVLIYGSRDVFDVCRAYRWPDEAAVLVRYCGFICTPQTPDNPKRIRARWLGDAARGTMITVLAGGGADGYELMSVLLDALPAIQAVRPCVLEVVTGPFMPDAQRLDLKRRAERLPVRVRTMVRNPMSRTAAADLVVAMAGYNTTMEVLRLGTPALLVPRRGPSREQRMRASLFAQHGWVSWLDPDELNADRLARAVLSSLSAPARSAPPPDLNGLSRTGDYLLSGVRSDSSAPTARAESETGHMTASATSPPLLPHDLDPALPSLWHALNPAEVAKQVARMWRGPGEAHQVRACVLDYVRWSPGVECSACFRLTLASSSGRATSTLWVVSVRPEGVSHRAFSDDDGLRGLAVAADPRIMRGWLAERLGRSVDECAIGVVRYRPETRCVLRYELSGRNRVTVLYGKLLAGEAAAHLASTLTVLGDGLAAPVVAAAPEWQFVVQSDTGGRSLKQIATSPSPSQLAEVSAAGRLLARLQARKEPPAATRSLLDDADMLTRYVAACRRVSANNASRLAEGIEGVRSLAGTDAAAAPAHGAFRLDQVHITTAGPRLIDLDSYCWAAPERDIGNLFAYLRWRAIRRPESAQGLAAIRDAFLAGYESESTAQLREPRLRAYEAASLLKIAGRRYPRLKAHEWKWVPQLIDAASAVLDAPAVSVG